ncbi:MAG: hypothetical protein ACOH1R_06875 [Luteimonas sp.]
MSLHSVFADIHPDWYRSPGATPRDAAIDTAPNDVASIDTVLLEQAQHSVLGRRQLARWLMEEIGTALLAPRPDAVIAVAVTRWPRERLAVLLRDLGALAFAPAIRAEVRREPVRQLKRALGNSYLLALDKQVWDGGVAPAIAAQLQAQLTPTLRAGRDDEHQDDAAIHALLDQRGRSELHAWAMQRDPALGEWAALHYPRESWLAAHLPEKQVLFLHDHHLNRATLS